MARQLTTLQIVIVGAVAAIAALAGEMWWQQYNSPHAPDPGSDSGSCLIEARSAYAYFRSNVRPFYNPPYDVAKWDAFKSEMEKRISSAESKCSSCFETSCNRARGAMSELGTVVGELDPAVRSGTFASAPQGIIMRLRRVYDGLQ